MTEDTAKSRKILIVDDDASIRLLVRSSLRKMKNVEFFEADNGAAGFLLVEKISPDLIFLDVVMPVMNGIDFLVKLREIKERNTIPVILLTGYKDKQRLEEVLELPNTTLITKPFIVEDLVKKAGILLNESV